MSQAVSIDGKKVTFPVKDDDLELGREFGIIVKEPHKFRSCAKSEPVVTTPAKVAVRDPHKLTDADKEAIDKAIRDANKVGDVSKLPNGTGENVDTPAFIEFDKDGNVRIISPNDVEVTWDSNFNPVYVKNTDGTYKLQSGKENNVIKIPAKDLVKNIKPDAPTLALSGDKKNITITPNLEVDTDAHIITVSYKDKDGKDQTTTATKADDGTWSITEGKGSVNQNGVVTLPVDKVKGNTDVTAKVTDKGGVADDDKTPLTSDQGTLTVKETIADKVEALGGLAPVDLKKWVKDTVDWKEGVKAKDSTKETEVNKLLAGATFEDVTETKRSTDKSGDFEGKVKVKFSDDSEIIVEKQMLYVSDPVSPSDKENLPEDAIDVELKLGEGVKAGDKVGNKETPVTAKTYKVKPGTDLSTEKVSKTEKTCFEDVGATVSDNTYVDIVWTDSKDGKDFKATADNKVFTATATKKFKVTVQANGGTGDDKVEYKKSGENFTLPAKDTFTPPDENQEFAGWLVGDATTTTEPGTDITINGDTIIKASWKPIELKVKFQTEAGASGTMKDKTVNKGSKYELPTPTFKPEEGKEFAGWKVGDGTELKQAGDKIDISGDVTLTAVWKDIMVDVSYDANGGSGEMKEVPQKKGTNYTLLPNAFTASDDTQEFDTWEVNGEKVAPGTKIKVDKDTVVKAIWKKIQVKVTYDANGGSGEMTEKTQDKGSEYAVLPNAFTAPDDTQEFDTWEVNGEKVAPGTKIKVDKDTVVKAIWKDIEYKVTFDGNKGTGSMDTATVKKGEKYKLPDNSFGTPPDKQGFKTWLVDGQEVAPGTEITIDKDTEVKALWKDKTSNPETPNKPEPSDSKKPSAPAITWRGLWYLGEKTEPAKAVQEMEIGRHYKYLYGYVDKTVRPEGMITRSEAAALIARLAELDMTDKTKPNFKDTPSAWYNSAINIMVKKDLMFGDKNGNFRPNEPITRGEFARALYYIDKKNDKVAPFADVKGHEFEAAINQAYGNDRIAGYPDGSFKPNAYIQRAEAARILNQYANRNVNIPGMEGVKKDLIHFTDINENHWAYCEIMEAANSHEYQRAKGSQVETWLRILDIKADWE
ncbi:MAG: S-layer homology domain-containing protein [Peptoniphilus sp. oral taxon 375]|nr:S-layer homology domain-containing protein [Peptoniphilus sp. oral taxon 375]